MTEQPERVDPLEPAPFPSDFIFDGEVDLDTEEVYHRERLTNERAE